MKYNQFEVIMLKRKAIAIFFILFSTVNIFSDKQLFNELFPEDRISVRGKSYTDFVFNGDGRQFFGYPIMHEIIVHGWSRGGFIFYTVFCLFTGKVLLIVNTAYRRQRARRLVRQLFKFRFR